MGAFGAYAMAEYGEEASIPLETQIRWHLSSNHYPPVPVGMIAPCVEAIDKANEGDWDGEITLPEGFSWRGRTEVPAHVLVEEFHLDAWIVGDDEDY